MLGVNGAGKTTTFKLMLGIEKPTCGEIYLLNSKDEIDYRKIGYCPQHDDPILENLTVKEHVSLYGRLKLGSEYDKARAKKPLRDLDLLKYTDAVASKLSGGNKRKLCVAIALIGNPEVLFLDEPTTGMDPIAKRRHFQKAWRDKVWDELCATHEDPVSLVPWRDLQFSGKIRG